MKKILLFTLSIIILLSTFSSVFAHGYELAEPDNLYDSDLYDDALNVDDVFNRIAGGAVKFGNNGFLFIQQQIEQGRFTGICIADERNDRYIVFLS